MLNSILGAVLAWAAQFFSALFIREKAKSELEKRQQSRLEHAKLVEQLGDELRRKMDGKASAEEIKEAKEKLREAARKLISM